MNAVLADKGAASSECDSGWTLYLQHSNSSSSFHYSPPPPHGNHRDNKSYRRKKMILGEDVHETYNAGHSCQEEEEEDLSMVSDASSGPPHFDLNDEGERNYNRQYLGNRKYKLEQCCDPKDFAHLDDTASSPFFFSPKKMNNGGGNYNEENHHHEVCSSLESMIDYSNSPAFSATHFDQERSRNLQEGYHFLQSPFSTDNFQQNQWS